MQWRDCCCALFTTYSHPVSFPASPPPPSWFPSFAFIPQVCSPHPHFGLSPTYFHIIPHIIFSYTCACVGVRAGACPREVRAIWFLGGLEFQEDLLRHQNGCWESNWGPLQKRYAILTTEPRLKPLRIICMFLQKSELGSCKGCSLRNRWGESLLIKNVGNSNWWSQNWLNPIEQETTVLITSDRRICLSLERWSGLCRDLRWGFTEDPETVTCQIFIRPLGKQTHTHCILNCVQ